MLVATGFGVLVAVGSGVGVFVAVGSGVGVLVAVGTGVGVLVAVGTGVGVFVGGTGSLEIEYETTEAFNSLGRFVPERSNQ